MNDNNRAQQDENTKREGNTTPDSKVSGDEANREADKNRKQQDDRQAGRNNS